MFYALLAVFPAIAALVVIYSLFADPATIRSHIESLSAVLPSGATSVIGDQINRLAAQGRTSLGVATFIGLAISLWSANAGMKALFDAMNIVYQEDEKRDFFELNAHSLGFTLGVILVAVIAMATVVALPPVLSYIGLPARSQNWINLLRWPLLLLFVLLAASIIYRYGPSRNEAKWRWLSPGAVLFTVGWLVASPFLMVHGQFRQLQ
jgi:membrane protein